MGYLVSGDFFENMLQLKSFGLYFERFLNSYCYISATEILRGWGHAPVKILK